MRINKTVNELSKYSLIGLVVPKAWSKHILNYSGKPNRLAIEILADIVSWYRPKMTCDANGTICIEQKFNSDILQMSYPDWMSAFNATRKEVVTALDLLISLKLVKKNIRHDVVWEKTGKKLGNVLFWELCLSEVIKISEEFMVKSDESVESKKAAKEIKKPKFFKKKSKKPCKKVSKLPSNSGQEPLYPEGDKGLSPESDNITTPLFTGDVNIKEQYSSSYKEDDITSKCEQALRIFDKKHRDLSTYALGLNDSELSKLELIKNTIKKFICNDSNGALINQKHKSRTEILSAIFRVSSEKLLEIAKKLTVININSSKDGYILTSIYNSAEESYNYNY